MHHKCSHSFAVLTVLICHHISFWFANLTNDGCPTGTNFTYNQVFKKRQWTFDVLVSLLIKSLNLCLSILLGLPHFGNGFLILEDLFFLENSTHKVPLLCKKQEINSEYVHAAFYWLNGAEEKVLFFMLICGLVKMTRGPFVTVCRCGYGWYEAHGRLKPKHFITVYIMELDCNEKMSSHFSMNFFPYCLHSCTR